MPDLMVHQPFEAAMGLQGKGRAARIRDRGRRNGKNMKKRREKSRLRGGRRTFPKDPKSGEPEYTQLGYFPDKIAVYDLLSS
jgi:hypothetical protein